MIEYYENILIITVARSFHRALELDVFAVDFQNKNFCVHFVVQMFYDHNSFHLSPAREASREVANLT